jgi:hypothetical protein
MSSTPHPTKPPEPGTVEAVKKLRDHQTDSVYGKLTEQESGRGLGGDGGMVEETPAEPKDPAKTKERGAP